jgi:SOS-response transcriptional repressor LexA
MGTSTIHISQQANLMLVLRQLLDRTDITANALAKKINLPTPTVNRLLTGDVQDPRASTLIEIANYFGITIDELLGRVPLNEKFIDKEGTSTLIVKPPLSIPVLSMIETTQFETHLQTPASWFRWQIQHRSPDIVEEEKIFAVTIKNNLYDPLFLQGSLLIVNPMITPSSGDHVLVSFINDSTAVIKKYISEGQHKYLYPLQKELKTINFDEKHSHIIGVIIASYLSFRE